MRTLAWHCAPHLALKLPEETPLTFSRTLPVSSRMRAKGVDVSDPARLVRAKLSRLGARRRTSPRTSPHPTASTSTHTVAEAGRVGSASSGRRSSGGEKADKASGSASGASGLGSLRNA